jgi:hypothetical protein
MTIHPQLDQLESAGLVRLAHDQPDVQEAFRKTAYVMSVLNAEW